MPGFPQPQSGHPGRPGHLLLDRPASPLPTLSAGGSPSLCWHPLRSTPGHSRTELAARQRVARRSALRCQHVPKQPPQRRLARRRAGLRQRLSVRRPRSQLHRLAVDQPQFDRSPPQQRQRRHRQPEHCQPEHCQPERCQPSSLHRTDRHPRPYAGPARQCPDSGAPGKPCRRRPTSNDPAARFHPAVPSRRDANPAGRSPPPPQRSNTATSSPPDRRRRADPHPTPDTRL